MKKIIKDYFSFNSRERVAIILLCCLLAFFWVLPEWYPKQRILNGLEAKEMFVSKTDSVQNGSVIAAKKEVFTFPKEAPILFRFDPNELSASGWKKLGLHDKTIQTILHYRQKGGRFRVPDDLKKIWGMLPSDAERLIPYVSLPVAEKPVVKNAIKPLPATIKPILINQASAEEISKLPGVGRALAGRMVKFRDKIGGFQNLDQLRRTYGLTDSIYNLIAPLIVLQE